ncbi:MAG: DUF11 domain-containing protein [Desulfuromonadales bacterium]|nr:DUF11 domain-containing protein [Desulfuromonadales bacterium]
MFQGLVYATRTITAATVDGGSTTTVAPGGTVTISITVETTAPDDEWRSTSWRISAFDGTLDCANTANSNAVGTFSDSFTVTVPTTTGTYNLYLYAYSDNNCGSGSSGTFVLPGAVIVSAGDAGSTCDTFRDEFTTLGYNRQDGTVNWSGDWNEVGDDDSASSGDIRVSTYLPVLQLEGDGSASTTLGGPYIEREADLSSYATATLSFDYYETGSWETDDSIEIYVSDDGGNNWTLIHTFTNDQGETSQQFSSDISAFISASTRIAFVEKADSSFEDFYLDNIQIEACGGVPPTVNSLTTTDTTPILTGTFNSRAAIGGFSVAVDSIIYTLGVDSELTNSGDDWTLDLSSATPLSLGTYDVVATSDDGAGMVLTDETIDELIILAPAAVLSKVASTSAAAVGDVVTFTITASNPDSDPLNDIVVTDILPAGMTYVSHTAPLGSLNVAGQTLTWTLTSLAAASSASLTLAVSLTQQGILTNTVTSPGSTDASATVLVLASAVTNFRMDEPVGSWDGTAGEVLDSGGTALHGRWNSTSGAASPVDPSPAIHEQYPSVVGEFCNAAEFDGNSVIEVADSSLFDYTTELSATAWIYPTAYPSELSSILSNDVNYEFHLNSSGHLYWWWQASTLTSAATIPLNQWTHVAITLDSSSGVRRQRIYINGVADANTNNWQGTLATNNCLVHIGGDVGTGDCAVISARNFRGLIDEVKLYGFEMTQAQVQADMTMGRLCSGTFDHLRLEHDGLASICAPETVVVKACMDSNCSSLYPGTVTVSLSPTGWVGGDTFSFSGGISSRRLSVGTAGDVTIGTNAVSPTAANSTRCFNGATETCTLNFAFASCDFDAVEPASAPQTSIYTKLSGVPFDIDVLALLDATTINTGYAGTVSVDLVDASSSVCPSGVGLNSATSITFTPADVGRNTVTFNYAGAARNVRVRATVGASAPACSSDNFAIRPQTFTVTSSDAGNTSLTGLPVVAAGDLFSLSAAGVSGYDGTPQIDTSLVSGTPTAGTLTGSFPAANAVTGIATGVGFSYSEVGHFGLGQQAIYDATFTQVDTAKNECTSDFSNTLTGGMYGCSFGSAEIPIAIGSSGFGRFVPARFNVSANSPIFTDACSGFSYLGQPFGYLVDPQLTLTALNRAGNTTLNYGGSYWRMNSSLAGRSYANNVETTAATLATATTGSVSWSGTGNSDGIGSVAISGEEISYSKPTAPEGPFAADANLVFSTVDLTDADGACYDPEDDGVCNGYSVSSIGGTELRYGRMLLQNTYGPETQPLTIPLQTEYFDGSAFIPNSLDSCTPYDFSNLLLGPYQAPLASGDTTASGSGSLTAGVGSLLLSAPGVGNDGSVELLYDLDAAGLDWLKTGGNNPTAKANFGIFRGNQRLIYMRESIW